MIVSRVMQPRRLPFFLLLSSLTAVAPALAEPPAAAQAAQVVVLLPQLQPPGAMELRERFHDAVIRGLAPAHPMSGDDVRLRLGATPELLECKDGPCIARVAALLDVKQVVVPEINVLGKDYSMKLHVYDALGNEQGTTPEDRCDICTFREATLAAEKAGGHAVALVEHPPESMTAMGEPTTQPTEAPKTAEAAKPAETAQPAETTKAAEAATAGPSQGLKTGLGEDETAHAAATTAPAQPNVATVPQPAEPEQRATSGYRYGAYAAFAVAGASLVTMVPFAYFASRESSNPDASSQYSCSAADPRYNCPQKYSGNLAPAVAFGVVGGVAAATGAVLLYLDHRAQKKHVPTVGAAPTRDGFAVSARLSF